MAKTTDRQIINGVEYEIMDTAARIAIGEEESARIAAVSAETEAREAGDAELKSALYKDIIRDYNLPDAYTTEGYLRLEDGTIYQNENHKTTGYLFLKQGATFSYSLLSGGAAFAVYDMDKNFVSAVGEGTTSRRATGTYTMPNDGYVRFSNRYTTATDAFVSFDVDIPISILQTIEQNQGVYIGTLREYILSDSYVVTGFLSLDNGEIQANENHKTTGYLFLRQGATFSYSLLSGGAAFVVYDMHKNFVSAVGEGTTSRRATGTYTMPNDGYVRFSNRYVSALDAFVSFDVDDPAFLVDLEEKNGLMKIEPYFEQEMQATINSVLNLMTEPCLVFPIITDIHYRYPGTEPLTFDHSIQNINYFEQSVRCDFILNLGDSSDGRAALADQIAYSRYQNSKIHKLHKPYYMVQGNHELNIYSSSTYSGSDKLTNAQIYNLYFSDTSKVVFNPDHHMDYYVDFEELNVRLIVLNFSNQSPYKVGDDTVTWYRDVALDENKTILLATHFSSIANHNSYPEVYTDENIATISEITENFVTGGGTLVNIYGHSHADFKFTTPWLQVALNNARPIQSDITDAAYDYLREHSDIVSPEREYGTPTEDCWTVCVLRPLSRRIDFIRFGAGSDRTGLSF